MAKTLALDLMAVLGMAASAPEVARVIAENAFHDTYDDPPFRRYVGAEKQGVDLLFEDKRVIDVQIYVQATGSYSAFAQPLPFGIEKGMTQRQIHHLLGPPIKCDHIDSQYLLSDGEVRLVVVYDKKGVVRYLSAGLPPSRRQTH